MIIEKTKYIIELSVFVPEASTEPDPAYRPNTQRRITDEHVRKMLNYPTLFECSGGYTARFSMKFKHWTRAKVMAEHARIIDVATKAGLVVKD